MCVWQCTDCRVLLPYKDIELIFRGSLWNCLASADLSCALEIKCVFFVEPSGPIS